MVVIKKKKKVNEFLKGLKWRITQNEGEKFEGSLNGPCIE